MCSLMRYITAAPGVISAAHLTTLSTQYQDISPSHIYNTAGPIRLPYRRVRLALYRRRYEEDYKFYTCNLESRYICDEEYVFLRLGLCFAYLIPNSEVVYPPRENTLKPPPPTPLRNTSPCKNTSSLILQPLPHRLFE